MQYFWGLFPLYLTVGGIEFDRKQGERERSDLQQRSLAKIESGMLPLSGMPLNHSATKALPQTYLFYWLN